MRLLSYNIHKGVGTDRRYRLERTIGVIEEENPDIICLQEVDQNVHRSNYHDQPRILADHFRSRAFQYQLNVPKHDGGYGNLVLSRWPFASQHQVSLRLNWRKPRGAQLQVIQTPEGPLHLVNWHLGLSGGERRWQVRHLLTHEAFSQCAHLPTLIAGDYNDWLNVLEARVFAEHDFRQATSPTREFRSFPSYLALTALDKLFYRGELNIRGARIVRTPLARRASDHLPLVVDFHLKHKHSEGHPPDHSHNGHPFHKPHRPPASS